MKFEGQFQLHKQSSPVVQNHKIVTQDGGSPQILRPRL